MTDESIFAEALAITDAAERAAYLDRMCTGNHELRQQVEALLAAHEAGSPLDQPPESLARTGPYVSSQATPGDRVGPYKLLEAIGEGGMGEVWMADQTEPVKRRVALKLIKPGMDSRAVLARFEAERQALALMDHPNIAKVFDAGATPDGRPYFVMELVKGTPITKFCDEKRLNPRERLELFVQACQAIQHAHQKGIIHRDIKPSNVLVALYDDKPVVKVIDFGVAKATGQPLTDKTLATGFGAVVGTPQYMSPEQATLNNLDIDTRSDVYSLGVLLYELLAGSPPFSRKELEQQGLMEILRVVREEEPPRPSTKLSTADALPSLSANRATDPRALTALLRGELDWIVMKALEKDRTRRYETANGFAADVQRYLCGEPVLAHPPSAAYRFKKFLRKNRPQVIAVSMVFVALVAGVVGTALGLLEANRQAEYANQQTEEAKKQEAEAKKQAGIALANEAAAIVAKEEEARLRLVAEAEKRRAIYNGNNALAALRATTGDDVEKLIGEKKELTAREKAYLEAIVQRWQTFAQQQGTDEQSRAIRAEGHKRVGALQLNLGRRDEAKSEFEQAIAFLDKLTAEFPAKAEYREYLADSYNGLQFVLGDLNKRTEALEYCRKCVALQEKLVAEFPNSALLRSKLSQSHNNVGLRLYELGRGPEAVEQYKKTLTLKEQLVADFPRVQGYRNSLAKTHDNLGILLAGLGKITEARSQHGKAIDLFEQLVAQDPATPDYRQALAKSYLNLGRLLDALRKWTEAEELYKKCLTLQEKLVAEFPAVPDYRNEMCVCLFVYGSYLTDYGKQSLAEELFIKDLSHREKLVAEFPMVVGYREKLADSHTNFGSNFAKLGKLTEAEQQFHKALKVCEKLATDFPKNLSYATTLGNACYNLGLVHRDRGKPNVSLDWFTRAIDTLRPVLQELPRAQPANLYLENSYRARANTYYGLGRYAESAKDWDRTLEINPQQPGYLTKRALSRVKAGMVSEAVAEVEPLTKLAGAPPEILLDFTCIYSVASSKVEDKKTVYADRAMELLTKAVARGYSDTTRLKNAPDLDPLRERNDFKKLITDLETKLPPKKVAKPPEK